MDQVAYNVALITRGAGAYGYSYSAPPGLDAGQLVVVKFRHSIELGVITGEVPTPADTKLLPLIKLSCQGYPGWGRNLLELSSWAAAAPHETARLMVFSAIGTALGLFLNIDDLSDLGQDESAQVAKFSGKLAVGARKKLLKAVDWDHLHGLAARQLISFELKIAGTAGNSRSSPAWRKWFQVEASLLALAGSAKTPAALPGSYLAGFAGELEYGSWPVCKELPDFEPPGPTGSNIEWDEVACNPAWELCRQHPGVLGIKMGRTNLSWDKLRHAGGIVSELCESIAAGQNCLLIAPQAWLLERLWPQLVQWAPRVHRYRSEGAAGAAAHILASIKDTQGHLVAGGPGAWRLLLYGDFDRLIMVDPSHPQYEPQRHPRLDPRSAALIAASRSCPKVDLVEMGISGFDGTSSLASVSVLEAAEDDAVDQPPAGSVDQNPLPLVLRQPDRKRLVYFNRHGSSRGLNCAECRQRVVCPHCHSTRLFYRGKPPGYNCPACGFNAAEVRCQRCGLANISALLPGLEAVDMRQQDYLVPRDRQGRAPHPEHQSILGMAELLEPLQQFWPEEIVYVHAEAQPVLLDDWLKAMDTAARLENLYENPNLEKVFVVSTRLAQQLGNELQQTELTEKWDEEQKLRRLALLPPFGSIYRITITGDSMQSALAGRKVVGAFLKSHSDTTMLRLGRHFQLHNRWQINGFFVNPQLNAEQLQHLRWEVHQAKSGLLLSATRGPWL